MSFSPATFSASRSVAASLMAVVAVVVFFVPDTVYWRDSGEFIIQGVFLDIAHPPGFPLYAVVANLAALVPVGPSAWRVHAGTALTGGALLLSILACVAMIRPSSSRGDRWALLAPLLLLGSATFLKQLGSAEVYVLNALLLVLLLFCFERFRDLNDVRWIFVAAFLSGLALGNHVSILFSLIPMVFVAVRSVVLRNSLVAIAFGIFGLLVYGYLPIRAANRPPLTSGNPVDAASFVAHLTDARDRVLRPSAPSSDDAGWEGARRANQVVNDARSIAREVGIAGISLAFFGFVALMRRRPSSAFALSAIIAGNWLFFSGWDPDPWAASWAAVSILAVCGIDELRHALPSREIRLLLSGGIGAATVLGLMTSWTRFMEFSRYDAPHSVARAALDEIEPYGVLLTDYSWFIASELHVVEGYRPDVTLVYQPSAFAPDFFPFRTLVRADGRMYPQAGESPTLSGFVYFALGVRPVEFEPSATVTSELAGAAELDEQGRTMFMNGATGVLHPRFTGRAAERLAMLRAVTSAGSGLLRRDGDNYFEARLNPSASLLASRGKYFQAAALIEPFCLPMARGLCSTTIYNNLAVLYLRQLRADDAVRVLETMAEWGPLDSASHSNLEAAIRARAALETRTDSPGPGESSKIE